MFGKKQEKSKGQLDFLAIGDITIDAFIHLAAGDEGSAVHTVCADAEKEHCELCLPFPDKIPFDKMIEVKGVGNSANAAVAVSSGASAKPVALEPGVAATVESRARSMNVGEDEDAAWPEIEISWMRLSCVDEPPWMAM